MSEPSSYGVWLNQEIQAGRQSRYQSEGSGGVPCTKNKDCKNPWCLDAARRLHWKHPHQHEEKVR